MPVSHGATAHGGGRHVGAGGRRPGGRSWATVAQVGGGTGVTPASGGSRERGAGGRIQRISTGSSRSGGARRARGDAARVPTGEGEK